VAVFVLALLNRATIVLLPGNDFDNLGIIITLAVLESPIILRHNPITLTLDRAILAGFIVIDVNLGGILVSTMDQLAAIVMFLARTLDNILGHANSRNMLNVEDNLNLADLLLAAVLLTRLILSTVTASVTTHVLELDRKNFTFFLGPDKIFISFALCFFWSFFGESFPLLTGTKISFYRKIFPRFSIKNIREKLLSVQFQ
jgi:hypothetical protein